MYMAPIVKAPSQIAQTPAHPALRRAVGLPVLAIAGVVALPWMAVQGLVAGIVLGGRGVVQAIDYAGTVALGR
jgi:hypothetical protein